MSRDRDVLHVLPHPGGGGERYVDALSAIPGYRHRRMALAPGANPLSGAASLPLRLPRAMLRARSSDVVTVHGDMAAILSLPLLRASASVIVTHGLNLLRRTRGQRQRLVMRGFASAVAAAGQTVCVSRTDFEQASAVVGPTLSRRLALVRNGVALPPPQAARARETLAAELGIESDEVIGLYLGELDAHKDPETAVRAAFAARERGAHFVLVIAGDGPIRGRLDQLGGGAVRLLGRRTDPERLLAASEIFVMPSLREGLSFAVLEAMASGCAMIVSDAPGNVEAVGEAGTVVRTGDVDGFADAISRFCADPAGRLEAGAGARRRAESEFPLEAMLGGMTAVYDAFG